MLKWITFTARLIVGLIFVAAGLDGLLKEFGWAGFFPQPDFSPDAMALLLALKSSKIMLLVKAVETLGSFLLLSGLSMNLGLILLAPIATCILVFHINLAPEGLPVAIPVNMLIAWLLWRYRNNFKSLFEVAPHASP